MTKSVKKLIAIILAIICVIGVFSIGFVAIANADEPFNFDEVCASYDTEREVHLVEVNWYNSMNGTNVSYDKLTSSNAEDFNNKTFIDIETGTSYLVNTLNNTTVALKAINPPLSVSVFVVPKYVNLYQLGKGEQTEVEEGAEPTEGCGYNGYFIFGNGITGSWDFTGSKVQKTRTIEVYDEEQEKYVKQQEKYYVAPSVGTVGYRYSQVVDVNQSFSGDKNPKLKTVLFPSEFKTIESGAFASNQYIEHVYAPDVTEVKSEAFSDCKDLTDCVLPSVRYVGNKAFYKNNRLSDFNFESCLKIGNEAFYDCVKFTSVEFSSELQELGQGAFKQCTGLTEVVIPSGVSINTIPKECFYLCTALENIEFSKEIINIGSQAFFNCYSLKILDLRTTQLEKIDSKAFWGCTNLEYVILPKSIVSFATDSFEKCDALRFICFTGQLSDAQINKIKSSDLGSLSILNVDKEGPVLYDTEAKKIIKEKEVKINHPVNYILFDAIDIQEAYVNEVDADLELGAVPNGYRTYVVNLNVDVEDEYNVVAKDFFGNESAIKILYSEAPIHYTVKFDGNGNTGGTMADCEYTGDEVKALPQNRFIKNGYEFAGWSDTKDGKTVVYTDMQEAGNLTSADGDIVTFYAVWKSSECKVVYNANGGMNTMQNTNFSFGSSVTLAANAFAKTGYTFAGWAETPDGEIKYNNKDKITPTVLSDDNTVNLYAKWTPNQYAVKFDGNGGKGEVAVINVKYDEEFTAPENSFVREGYTFIGWGLTKNQKDSLIKAGEPTKNLSEKVNGSVVLYANWSNETYSVTFHSNTEIEETRKQDISVTSQTELMGNPFERTGYSFAGWSKEPSGTPEYKNKASVNHLANSGENVDLYAIWNPHKYTVKFAANGGTGQMESITIQYDAEIELPACSFAKDGYQFAGWTTNPTINNVNYQDCEPIKNLLTKDGSSITLYATWTNNSYTVVFHSNDGTEKTHKQNIIVDRSTTLTANPYKKTGYSFEGWGYQESSGVEFKDRATVINLMGQNGTVDLYAIWKPITYTVTLDGNGAKNVVVNNKLQVVYDQKTNLPANEYYKAGAIFGGWTTKKGTVVMYENEAEIFNLTDKKDITLYVVWYPIEMGDVDGDGKVSPADARMALRKAVMLDDYSTTSSAFAASDTDNDGRITPADARKILRVAVQLEKFK